MNLEIPVVRGPLEARQNLIRIGTRGSELAVTQTTGVAHQIAASTGHEVALVIITTKGDTSPAPLAQLGGTGVFVSALRDALLAGECDLAVHSLKDLPTGECPGIVLGAIPPRADARDALCARDGLTLDELPQGARVGTGSPRRSAQLLRRRPDLEVTGLRGNVDSRLARVGNDLDAVVLAAAGLTRIGREHAITELFSLADAPAAPGQGALAVEARTANTPELAAVLTSALAALDDPESRACALAERSVLATLEAGCQAPVGAWARFENDKLRLSGVVYAVEGNALVESTLDAEPLDAADAGTAFIAPDVLGARVARQLLSDGAAEIAPLTLLTGETRGIGVSEDTGATGGSRQPGNAAREEHTDPPDNAERRAAKVAHLRPPVLPLTGLRILIPRGGNLGAALQQKILDRGGKPTVAQLLTTAPPSNPAAFEAAVQRWNAGEYDWLVVTSATTAQALKAAGAQPGGKVAAVGPVTAAAIQELGFRLHVMPARDYSGRGLAQSLRAALPTPGLEGAAPARVLLPVSEIADVTVEDALREAGHHVDRVAAYTTEICAEAASLQQQVAAEQFDVLLATSSSAARAIAQRLAPLPAATRVAAIGAPTARMLAEVGLPHDIVATSSTTDGLLDAVSIALVAGARETHAYTRQGEPR